MKIVNRKTFLALPENTIFSKYDSYCFGNLCIKDETWSNDFIFLSFHDAIKNESSSEFFDILKEKSKTGEHIEMDFESYGRDGFFDEDQLFAIWEKEDIVNLIEILKRCI